MTPDTFLKIKKYGLYALAGIGVFAVLLFAYQYFSWGPGPIPLPGISQYGGEDMVGKGGGSPVGLGAPSTGFFDEKTSTMESRSSDITNVVSEGELTQRKVIKNGSLSLFVKKAEEVADRIKGVAEKLSGFVSDSRIYEVSAGIKSGSITIRVPADKFDEAMREIKTFAVKVESENVNASDVTEQFIDLEARLKNLKAEEEQYIQIMKRAVTVEDTLNVAQRLSDVRGRIEQIEGQLQYLSRQVDMSTITVDLTAEEDVEVFGVRWRPLFVAKQAFRNMLTGLTRYVDAMIGFVFNIPLILLWLATFGIGGFIVWRVLYWVYQKYGSSPPGSTLRKK